MFKGYFDKEKDGKKYYNNTGHRVVTDEIKKDITLYAQWTDNRSDVQKEHDKQIEDERKKKEKEEKEEEGGE